MSKVVLDNDGKQDIVKRKAKGITILIATMMLFSSFSMIVLISESVSARWDPDDYLIVDGIRYYVTGEDTMEVTSTSYAGDIVVPATIVYWDITYTVTAINPLAFYYGQDITSVGIPWSIVSIPYDLFERCSSLISIYVDPENENYSSKDGLLFNKDQTELIWYPNEKQDETYAIPYSVTSIATKAFYGCKNLISITVEEGNENYSSDGEVLFNKDKTKLIRYPAARQTTGYIVPAGTSILGDCAFTDSTKLESIDISSVETIGNYAFEGCTRLASITIPSSVTNLGDYVFQRCIGLTSVDLGSVTAISTGMFADCTGLASIEIPSSVTSIGYVAFFYCTRLTSIDLGQVTTIGNMAFCGVGLISIDMPSSVRSIGRDAFTESKNLESVDLSSVETIGEGAFSFCTRLTSINLSSVETIGEGAFSFCTRLTSINLSSVETIGDNAFFRCIGLTSITIPPSVTTIGRQSFSGCTGLTSITIPSSVTIIGDLAFSGCTNLESIDVEEGNANYSSEGGVLFNGDKTTLMQYPISNTMEDYVVPSSVTDIGYRAFSGCTGLTSVTIPGSVMAIGSGSFGDCTGLTSITIPSSVTIIGDSAFYGCTGLTSITIPSSVTIIGDSAFIGCTGLTFIDVQPENENYSAEDGVLYNKDKTTLICYPAGNTGNGHNILSSVTNIGTGAFYGCTNLTSITIPSSVTIIGDSAFIGCTGLTSITIPSSVTIIGHSAFIGCTGLTSITIPSSVTSIGNWAFDGCTKLSVLVLHHATNLGYGFQKSTFILWVQNEDVLISAMMNDDGNIEIMVNQTNGKVVEAVNVAHTTEGGVGVTKMVDKWIFTPTSGETEFRVQVSVSDDIWTTLNIALIGCIVVALLSLMSLLIIRRK